MPKIGDQIVLDFVTHNPNTGNITDADTLPTCEVFENDNDTPILSLNATKRNGKIGNYRVSFFPSPENGFEVKKSYNVVITATVSGVTAKAVISSFVLEKEAFKHIT